MTIVKPDLAIQVQNALLKAMMGTSKLPRNANPLRGASTMFLRHFLNNLCDFEGVRYLEIGTFKGGGIISAAYGNEGDFNGVDDWSQPGGQEGLVELSDRFSAATADIHIVESSFEEVDPDTFSDVNVFRYDAVRGKSQLTEAIIKFSETFDDECVMVIENWNAPGVRNGTEIALRELGWPVTFRMEVRPHTEERPHHDRERWWHGVLLAVIKRPSPEPVSKEEELPPTPLA